MGTEWRSIPKRGAQTAVVVCLVLLAGCARQAQKGVAHPEPPQIPPEIITSMPPPVAPEPTQEDLAFVAAGKAEAEGDPGRATLLYESAAALSTNDNRLAEIYFALALLHTDPTSATRDLPRGRLELQRVLDGNGDHPRVRDARILAAMLDEVAQLRAQSADQRVETEAVKGDLAALKARLEEKEKELAEIKKILLQDKKKP